MRNDTFAAMVASFADEHGVEPKHVAGNPGFCAQLGVESIDAEVVTAAERIFRTAIRHTLERAEVVNRRLAGSEIECTAELPKPPKGRRAKPSLKDSEGNKRSKPSLKDKTESSVLRTTARRRISIFGFSVSSVLRWMGANGWHVEAAFAAVTEASGVYDISINAVKTYLYAGKSGSRGEPAAISAKQAKQLLSYAK